MVLAVEVANPVSGVFSATGSMTAARSAHTATLLQDGTVLIAGGGNPRGILASAELYDPVSGTFSATGSMTEGRYVIFGTDPSAQLLQDGTVLIAGGYGVTGILASAELYDAVSGTFSATGSMITARAEYTATLLQDGQVLITGGNDRPDSVTANAELYDPITGTFTATGSMTTARLFHTATLLQDGQVLITGGQNFVRALSSAELYET